MTEPTRTGPIIDRIHSSRNAAFAAGLAVGALYAASIVTIDEADDRWAAAGSIGLLAVIAAFAAFVFGFLRRVRSTSTFAASCLGIFLGVLSMGPLEGLVNAVQLRDSRRVAEELRQEILSRLDRGAPMPSNEELSRDSRWRDRFDRLRGDLHVSVIEARDFEIVVKDPSGGYYGSGVHRLDSRTGEWRFENTPFVIARLED